MRADILYERRLLDRIDFQFARYDYYWKYNDEGERTELVPMDDGGKRENRRLFIRGCILAEGYGG